MSLLVTWVFPLAVNDRHLSSTKFQNEKLHDSVHVSHFDIDGHQLSRPCIPNGKDDDDTDNSKWLQDGEILATHQRGFPSQVAYSYRLDLLTRDMKRLCGYPLNQIQEMKAGDIPTIRKIR